MSITRKLPDSDIGRQRALNTAMGRVNDPDSIDNILSSETTLRLIEAHKNFDNGIKAITASSAKYHRIIELARPQRALLGAYVNSYFASIKSNIRIHNMEQSVRGYYNLAITNSRQPDISSDDKLLKVSETIISGDLKRCADGGIEMSSPTIEEFTEIYNIAKPFITAISNANTAMITALANLKALHEEVDDLIDHIWGEVQAKFSKDKPSNRRAFCRIWGVRYINRGDVWLLKGICLDSITNEIITKANLHLVGSKGKVVFDENGHFSLHTTLYEDLELIATLEGYEDKIVFFTKEKGVLNPINVVMVKIMKVEVSEEEVAI